MPDNQNSLRIAQGFGITASAFLTGYMSGCTILTIGPLLQSPTPLILRQWQALYDKGKATAPVIATVAALAHSYSAYSTSARPSAAWKLYTLAAALTFGIAPYTLTVMKNVNGKLAAKNKETAELSATDDVVEVGLGGESAKALVDWWGTLNLIRASGPLLGAVAAVWATLG